MKYVKGDLISLALNGEFDVIAHGCNCFCAMGAGIAPKISRQFKADTFKMESKIYKGDLNKLGTIDYQKVEGSSLIVVNCYSQFKPGPDLSYAALELCLIKLAHTFPNKRIGIPFIGAGLAGGDPVIIYDLMRDNLHDKSTLVIFEDHLYDIVEELVNEDSNPV